MEPTRAHGCGGEGLLTPTRNHLNYAAEKASGQIVCEDAVSRLDLPVIPPISQLDSPAESREIPGKKVAAPLIPYSR